jgi:hypothetical protein
MSATGGMIPARVMVLMNQVANGFGFGHDAEGACALIYKSVLLTETSWVHYWELLSVMWMVF